MLRHLIATHRILAFAVVAFALALRLTVPTGYMLSAGNGGLSVTLCPDGLTAASAPAAMAAMHHAPAHTGTASAAHLPAGHDHEDRSDHDRPDQPCAFAGLSAQWLGGADPVVLAAALAFVARLALTVAPAPIVRPVTWLRPPLRGPPIR